MTASIDERSLLYVSEITPTICRIFLGWWATAARAVWRTGGGGPYARAASIASAAILVHSLVDFPLRTAAISASFAMCLALLIDRRPATRQEPNDLRESRHLVVN